MDSFTETLTRHIIESEQRSILMSKAAHYLRLRKKTEGQGVIEYAGAMIVAALIVAMLATGMTQNNWMYNAYNSIFNAAGNMMITAIGNL